VTSPIPGFGGRREAREEALAVLYEVESTGATVADALAARRVEVSTYAALLASGVDEQRAELDDLIRRNLTGWRLERMAVVDRILVRIGAWELCNADDVPTGVALSEAVELATQYSGEDSPKFVNGLLRAVANEVRGPESA
jgi:N utilization substance protein B